MVPLQQPWSTLGVPWRTLGVPLEYLGVPLEFLCSTRGVAPDHPTTPSARVRPRTSVGAHPHVPEVGGGAILAADDVDGPGGVDHGRVVSSRSPRRAECAARPRHTCGHAGDRPMGTNATRARGRPQIAGYIISIQVPARATRVPAQRRDTHTRPLHTHKSNTHAREDIIRWICTNRRTCALTKARGHGHPHMHVHTHAGKPERECTHRHSLHTQTHTRTQSYAHAHVHYTNTHAHAHKRERRGYMSVQQHRQIHFYILRCRESEADKIRNECGACVPACKRVCVRARAGVDPWVVQNTRHNRLSTQEYPHEYPLSASV
jgi:hypothetical protein